MCVYIYPIYFPCIQAEVIGLALQKGSLIEWQPEMVHVPFSLLSTWEKSQLSSPNTVAAMEKQQLSTRLKK